MGKVKSAGVLISFILFTQDFMFYPSTAVSFVLTSFDFVICLTPLRNLTDILLFGCTQQIFYSFYKDIRIKLPCEQIEGDSTRRVKLS